MTISFSSEPPNYYSTLDCRLFEQPNPNGQNAQSRKIPTKSRGYLPFRRLNPQVNVATFAIAGIIVIKVSHITPGTTTEAPGATGKPPRLLDQVSTRMRRLGLARRTEEAYVSWIRRFILSQG